MNGEKKRKRSSKRETEGERERERARESFFSPPDSWLAGGKKRKYKHPCLHFRIESG